MYTQKKRTIILIIISTLMNFIYFILAYYLRLPLWLDTSGTIFASIILGFPAGFIVAIINNISQAIFFYGTESLNFYFVSAVTALVAGTVMKKLKQRKILRWFVLLVSVLVVSIFFAVTITFIAYDGVPSDYWGRRLYHNFIWHGTEHIIATILSVFIVKLLDVFATITIVFFSYFLTPKVLRKDEYAVI